METVKLGTATLTIDVADPKDFLGWNIIRIYCKKCQKNTLHTRVVRDFWLRWNKRKPLNRKPPTRNNVGQKAYWSCQECEEVIKF